MKKETKILFVILLALSVISLYPWYQLWKFPIKSVIGDRDYSDGFISARFPDMKSCESDKEMGNWLCDSSDPNNIKCRISSESTVVSYCK